MAGEEKVTVQVANGKANLTFVSPTGESELHLDEAGLLALIKGLGKAHAALLVGKQVPPIERAEVEAVFDTRWHVNPEMMNEATAMTFYHPSYGPLGFLIPIGQVPQMISALSAQVQAAQKTKTNPQ